MRTKITFASFALILAALASSSAMAQQPTISIADSTGRRDAVVAIVIPTQAEIKQTAQSVVPPAAQPWTAYFIGQTKSANLNRAGINYGLVSFSVLSDGSIRINGAHPNASPFNNTFMYGGQLGAQNLPSVNSTMSGWVGDVWTMGQGGDSGNGPELRCRNSAYAYPTGMTVNSNTPTGWSIRVDICNQSIII